ncbi:hypothetical protein EHM76_00315 [bacterium]|nr:MAG: hypothetical protein EHM76_00315 [bacterium]
MTRKDYILIANALADARRDIIAKEGPAAQSTLLDGTGYAADWLADSLARDNPRFDRARFLKACGVAS